MRYRRLLSAGLSVAIGSLFLWGPAARAPAQTAAAPAAAQANPALDCKPDAFAPVSSPSKTDPFDGRLAGPDLPPGLLPISDPIREAILNSGLPCQERVNPAGPPFDNPNVEDVGLENLQRGFDFYSWRTFIAMNAPADGKTRIDKSQANMRTRWEDPSNFKQLLDVMLPANMQPPKWPTDKAGMDAERERLMPPECSALHKQMPGRMVVKMIEESFNEPFKTGPLIDQQGRYAIFDILMNRTMFDYMMTNHLNTKAGQAGAAGLVVDFPPGDNNKSVLGAFMLKVSWKILVPAEIQAKNFHMVDALVLMPPGKPDAKRPCLPETLGLIGFHAVHKTKSRPQWIWTSFEHKQNVPDRDEVSANNFNGPYNFFSVSCKSNDCPAENATPPFPWDPDPALELRFRKDGAYKSQIVRETPLTHAAKNMNTIFHSILKGTVWENYILISTQWPSAFSCASLTSKNPDVPDPKNDFIRQPDMNCSPAPTYMANSTLETYSQGDIPQASSSCIGCHGNAVGFQTRAANPKPGDLQLNQSDFTFMLEKAQ
jgi:hypothetical protein